MPKCDACKKVATVETDGMHLCLDHYVELKMTRKLDEFLTKHGL